jgi:hypothetical protein
LSATASPAATFKPVTQDLPLRQDR